MLYLFCAILCSASINLGFALVKEKGLNSLHATLFNYLTATAVSLVLLLGNRPPLAVFSLQAMADNFHGTLTADGSMTFALLFGAITGVVYIASLLAIQYSILRSGPSPATIFNKLGLILPILLSVALFHERPTAIRWFGVAVALMALVIFNWSSSFRPDGLLLAVFLLGGVAESASKLFSVWSDQAFKPLYLLCVFGTAAVLCILLLLFRREKQPLRASEAVIGTAIGAVNLGSSVFVIRALTVLPSAAVFPALCAGVILVIALCGKLFFGEHLGRRGMAAILLTIVGLILINL